MGLSGFVDIAIGLVLMYLVLSLICTTVNELIASGLKWRAKSLSKAMTQLIDNEELRKAFYNSGLISNAKTASRGGTPAGNLPEGAAPAKGAETGPAGKPKDSGHPSYLDGKTFALALFDSLTETKEGKKNPPADKNAFPTLDDIKKIAGELPDSNIRDVMLASLASGEKTVAEVRDSMAAWFDSAMDRLSGDYKRSLKVLSLIVGIGVAFAFNADSLSVGQALWGDETLRGQIVNAAAQYVDKPPADKDCKNDDPQKETACLYQKLKQQQEGLRPFPIGWPDKQFYTALGTASGGACLLILLLKILGCLWTGLALSLGAPFWFDILQKFMNIRGTGVKPAETKK
jgi:hypothetical protein